MSQLTIRLNNQVTKRVKLTKPTYLIGRNQQCDIVLPERTISSRHAKLINTGEDCFLEDTLSTNGVYVNSHAVRKHLLIDKDTINIGKYQITFHSSANLLTQIRQLSVHPRISQAPGIPWLEIRTGIKQGNIIPLKREQITLGEEETGSITVERTPKGRHLLHGTTEDGTPETIQLSDNDSFHIGDIELVFHKAE